MVAEAEALHRGPAAALLGARLRAFYTRWNPEKLPDAPATARRFVGRVEELQARLVRRYGARLEEVLEEAEALPVAVSAGHPTDFEDAEPSEKSTLIASPLEREVNMSDDEGQETESASHHAKFLMIELTGSNLTWDERKDEPWAVYRDNVAKKFKQGYWAKVCVFSDAHVLKQLIVADSEQRNAFTIAYPLVKGKGGLARHRPKSALLPKVEVLRNCKVALCSLRCVHGPLNLFDGDVYKSQVTDVTHTPYLSHVFALQAERLHVRKAQLRCCRPLQPLPEAPERHQ